MSALEIIRTVERNICQCADNYYWCALCSRATCHAGEHSTVQLLKYASADEEGIRRAEVAEAFVSYASLRVS